MISFKVLVTCVVITAFVAGSPYGRTPTRIALLNGVPFIYTGANEADVEQLSEVTTPTNQINDLLNDSSETESDQGEDNNLPKEEPLKRSALRFAIARRSNGLKAEEVDTKNRKLEKYTPALSVGAMMNLRDFFDGLRENVNMLQSKAVTPEEFRALSSLSHPVESFRSVSQYVGVEDSHIRPTANAAYLHAIRMYRPSNRVRALVAHHPEPYRGTNNYNPSYLWAGLG